MRLKLYYGGDHFAIVEDGQMITIKCAKRKGKSDIVVETIADRSQLSSPTLSIDGSILTITDTSGVAESFIIYSNGDEIANISDTTVDLSDLITIASGVRSVTAVAVSLGYENSEISNAIEYKVGKEISGTWLIYENPSLFKDIVQSVKFSAASKSYTKFEIEYENGVFGSGGGYMWYDHALVYTSLGTSLTTEWESEDYRTVTFDGVQLVSEIFYYWFTANATEIQQPTPV